MGKAHRVVTLFIRFSMAVWGLAAAGYVVVLAINWNDELPSASAVRLEETIRARAAVPDEANAYVYCMGFSVAPGEDPWAWGRRRLSWAQPMPGRPEVGAESELPGQYDDPGAERAPHVRKLSESCNDPGMPCLDRLNEGDTQVAAWLASEQWLLRRYEKLLQFPAWRETVPFDLRFPLPAYGRILDGQQLMLARAWLEAGRGDVDAVQVTLEADARFWRRRLVDADTLISKLIAAAALRRHFVWSNLILRRLPPQRAAGAVPPSWEAPISSRERSMLRAFSGEWMLYKSVLEQAQGSIVDASADSGATAGAHLVWLLLEPTLQVQASSNRYADHLIFVNDTLDVPYWRLPAAMEQARAIEARAAARTPFPDSLYNLLGDHLFHYGNPRFSEYAAQVADLEGVRRMLLLATGLRSRQMPPEAIEQSLRTPANADPYGRPFGWSRESKALLFTGLAAGEKHRHEMPY